MSEHKPVVLRAAEALIPHRFIASQLRRPHGRFGRWVMTAGLNRGNAEIIRATLDALALRSDDVFMDLGFGGGHGIELAAQRTSGALWGVDFSPDVVAGAGRRLAPLVIAGRLNLLTADVADLPLRDGLISAICTTNTIYFWPDPSGAITSLRRVLVRGGRIAIGYTGASKLRQLHNITRHGFKLYDPAQVETLLREGGLREIRTVAHSGKVTQGDFTTTAIA